MHITAKHLIAGNWTQEVSPSFSSINPRTKVAGEQIFSNASENEINAAVEAAWEAFKITRLYAPAKLAKFLETLADEIEAIGELLLTTCDTETGLGLTRLTGERGRTVNQLRAFANHLLEGSYVDAIIDTALPNRSPSPRPDIRQMKIAIGPVAVFSPNNFPLAFGVAGGDTASAFAAGCPVIAKGHPSHPATSDLVAQAISRAIEKCDFPKGFFSLLQGTSIQVGQSLVQHPKLAAVGFTGSLRGGKAIFDTANQRPKPIPVYAEMGSLNPVIILPDKARDERENTVNSLVTSVTLGSGQFCTNPGLILMMESPETDEFIQAVALAMSKQSAGVLLNEGVERSLVSGLQELMKKDGVTLLTGGQKFEGDSYCFENTVMKTKAKSFLSDPSLRDEHFGPVTLFVICESFEELETVIADLDGHLTATIFASNHELGLARKLFHHLEQIAGRVLLNAVPTGVEVVHAMVHGGPYPATTMPNSTSVGMTAIQRFMRPIAYQNLPDGLLPDALKNDNPLGIWRIVNNEYSKASIGG